MAMKNSNKILNFYKICYEIIKSARAGAFVYPGREQGNKKDGKGSAFSAANAIGTVFIPACILLPVWIPAALLPNG